jgi:hypothetical protein
MRKPPLDLCIRAAELALQESDLPAGVIGRVEGIALVYDVVDDHGTTFVRGCLDRTRAEKVAAGKVKLYWDHGKAMLYEGFYDSDLHIGTVRSLSDVTLPDGRIAAYMVADLIDCPKAHEVKDYVRGVIASGGTTGLSIGFVPRSPKPSKTEKRGTKYTEIELREISITSSQSVPDSELLAERSSPAVRLRAALDALIGALGPDTVRAALENYEADDSATDDTQDDQDQTTKDHQGNANADDSHADAGSTPAEDSDAEAEDSRSTAPQEEPEFVSMEQRFAALRQTYATQR